MKNLEINYKKAIGCLLLGCMLATTPICKGEINPKWMMDSNERIILDSETEKNYEEFINHIINQDEEIYLTGDYDKDHRVVDIFEYSDYRMLCSSIFYKPEEKIFKCKYYYSKEDSIANLEWMRNEMNNIMDSIYEPDMNDWDKVLATYKYMCNNFTYYKNYDKSNSKYLIPNPYHPEEKQLRRIYIYDLLKTKQGVCHSFSYFLTYCLQMQGIESYNIVAQELPSLIIHQFVLVNIDGKPYYLDPTYEITHKTKLRYFGETTNERSNNDSIWLSGNAPITNVLLNPCGTEFSELRKAKSYKYVGDNTWEIKLPNGTKYFNTNSLSFESKRK